MIGHAGIEPVENPDAVSLTDAVQKGLGRAFRWAKNGLWSDDSVLLNACLQDLRYDRQCEEARGPWLWQIMEAVGATDKFRSTILDRLQNIDDGLAGQQHCQFALFYARRGDDQFRQCLNDIVARKPDPDYPSFGEEELIELDGKAGFLFASRIRGNLLASREGYWEDTSFIDDGIAKFGRQEVLTLLERESQTCGDVKRLYDHWLTSKEEQNSKLKQSHAGRMRQISLSAVIQIAEHERSQAGILRGWGMFAEESALCTVRDRLLSTGDATVLANYLRVFSNRAIPEFREQFIRLLDHPDDNVRARAFVATAQNSHPAIRKFALTHLNDRIAEFNFLQMFIRNFEAGDEGVLLEALQLPDDIDRRHWMLMDLRKILENNAQSRCGELAPIIYFWTPCGSCRRDTFKLMTDRKVAPHWITDECQYDAIEDTRLLATAQLSAN